MKKVSLENKPDLLILDECSNLPVNQISGLSAFLNTKIVRTTNDIVGLVQGTQDSQIILKAIEISKQNTYRTVTIQTQDRGKDGDKTFQTAYKNIGIISVKNENINKISKSVHDLASIKGYLIKINPDKTTKTKYTKSWQS